MAKQDDSGISWGTMLKGAAVIGAATIALVTWPDQIGSAVEKTGELLGDAGSAALDAGGTMVDHPLYTVSVAGVSALATREFIKGK